MTMQLPHLIGVEMVAHPMLTTSGMKDLLFIVVTIAFFAVSWLYARSLDSL